MTRAKFEQRRIRLVGAQQLATALALLPNLPLDAAKPLEILIREEVKGRKLDQNALMWAGPLRDIAEQCWIDGRQHSADVWHEYFKAEFLPDEYDQDLCKTEHYMKWDFDPAGRRILVGSTTDLTIKGMAQYITQIHAFGGSMGVEFHEHRQQY